MTALPVDLPPLPREHPLPLPAVIREKLENGLEVWMVPRPGIPLVAVRLAVRGGRSLDGPGEPGFSNLLASALGEGTEALNGSQIAERLQGAGGELATEATEDALALSVSGLAARSSVLLALLADVVRRPAFQEREIARVKSVLAEELATNETDAAFLADRAFRRLVYDSHPYAVAAPTAESIAAATPDSLRKAAARRLRPDRCLLVAVGSLDSGQLLSEVARALGSWRAEGEPPAEPGRATAPSGSVEVHVVDRPGSVQTQLVVGGLGVARKDADSTALGLAVTVYGGAFSSRLVSNLREEKGYTYSPGAASRMAVHGGIVETRAAVRNEVTGAALEEILGELRRMATVPATEEELERSRRRDLGAFGIATETNGGLARELQDLWLNGLPPEEFARWESSLRSLTSEDLRRVAAVYLASPARVVAVGDARVLSAQLAVPAPLVE